MDADAATGDCLATRHDVVMLDLDGVVYIGGDAVPGAPEHLATARGRGARLAFVTNNASRPPSTVAEHLDSLGVDATVEDVVTSAQAAARLLRERLGEGRPVAVLGAPGLVEAVRAGGLEPVGVEDDAEALVTGYGPDVAWREVMRAAVRIRDGLWWVASNTDMTIPTPFGTAPGHGVLVDTLRRFAGVEPDVAGKPSPPLLEETIRRTGAERPLMVGDRLDTDIAGGRAVDVDTLLVMTGVTGLAELAAAGADERPTWIAADLSGLLDAPYEVSETDGTFALGGWSVATDGTAARVDGDGSPSDWWRVVAAAAWAGADVSGLEPPGQ